MRPRSLIVDSRVPVPEESLTYERVRRTLDDALAELELEIDLEDGITDRMPRLTLQPCA